MRKQEIGVDITFPWRDLKENGRFEYRKSNRRIILKCMLRKLFIRM